MICSRIGVVFWLLSLFLFACNSSETKQVQPPLIHTEPTDEAVFEKLPLANIKASSFKLPSDKFGAEMLFDTDSSTFWVTTPGSVTGEFFSIVPEDPLMVSYIQFKVPNSPSFCKVLDYQLIINNEDPINVQPGEKIEIRKVVNKLQLTLGKAEGMNKVEFKPDIDSVNGKLTLSELSGILYTSKSAAVSSFEMYNADAELISFQLPIYKKVKLSASSVKQPRMQYNTSFAVDENLNTHWAYNDSVVLPQTLIFSFEDYLKIDGMKLRVGNHTSEDIFKSCDIPDKVSFGLRVGEKEVFNLAPTFKEHKLLLKEPLYGKVFSLTILNVITNNGKKALISNLYFTSQGKKVVPISDSLAYIQRFFTDSVKKTTLKPLIDSYYTYFNKVKTYPFNLKLLADSTFTSQNDTLPERISEISFNMNLRSNQTIDINALSKIINPRNLSVSEKSWQGTGRWILQSANPEITTLKINFKVKMVTQETDKSGRMNDKIYNFDIEEIVEISNEFITGFTYLPKMKVR